jgi:DNA polymerase-3 subunit delta
MAEVKSAQADAFVERPDPAFRVILLYGPDQGLVSERAETLATRFGVDLSDPFSLIRMDADIAAGDARLAEEAGTIGMFGGSRLLRVSGSTRRNLADAVKPVLENPPPDCWILIEAGDLKRDSALRRLVERSKAGMAIPCYSDDDRSLDRLIGAELQKAGLSIDAEARQVLKSQIGSDRKVSRNEIEKLALYCQGRGRVTAADVVAVIGDTAALATDDVVDAAVTGDLRALEDRLSRLIMTGTSPDMLVLATLRHFQALHAARYRIETQRVPAEAIVAAMRPPLHYTRKNAFQSALRIWSLPAIGKALARLDHAALEARANPGLSHALAGTALLAIAAEAARISGGRR